MCAAMGELHKRAINPVRGLLLHLPEVRAGRRLFKRFRAHMRALLQEVHPSDTKSMMPKSIAPAQCMSDMLCSCRRGGIVLRQAPRYALLCQLAISLVPGTSLPCHVKHIDVFAMRKSSHAGNHLRRTAAWQWCCCACEYCTNMR